MDQMHNVYFTKDLKSIGRMLGQVSQMLSFKRAHRKNITLDAISRNPIF